ncbi:MAG: hypothetical protein QGI78_06675 [Phycisphaerales bacterium]|jgi:hypothetical protein|nr:hypothetical protein [Phycisphaerales bacterium]
MTEDTEPKEDVNWSVCPAKLRPKRAMLAWFVIVMVGLAIMGTSIGLGVCMAGVLIATQATFLFTTHYAITEDGLRAKYPLKTKFYTWKQIQRVKFFKEACFLFTRKKPSNLDGWSGMTVMYGDDRDRIVNAINAHLEGGVAT